MARILIADDDAATREFVRRALAADGHSVVVAGDGGAALDRFRRERSYDVLVTDVDMPGVDGISLARAALAFRANTAIILMSGFADGLERARGLEADRLVTISKPFSLEQIRSAVRRLR